MLPNMIYDYDFEKEKIKTSKPKSTKPKYTKPKK